ncbi:MAG: alpha/beta hydrolase [Gemmatimonadota bacterium]|nr:MAG: alpha/beta hydrolase [Gemmatimonadota bacterium]
MKIGNTIINVRGDFDIACTRRLSGNGATVVFIHGFGSAKEHFRYAFDSPSLEGFSLVVPDLVGFGQSRGPEEFGYRMKDQAAVILQLLDRLEIVTFHLCAHSMGGLIAMNMAEMEPFRVLSLIDMEGNLTPEDCFISGQVAERTFEEFVEKGRRKLEVLFRDAGLEDPSMREYVNTFAAASTEALYTSACHTVEVSSTPLVERLSRIRNVCFIYGEKNRGLYPGEALLQAAGVPIFYIKDAGHSMATENPKQLFSVIRSFIDGVSRTAPGG